MTQRAVTQATAAIIFQSLSDDNNHDLQNFQNTPLNPLDTPMNPDVNHITRKRLVGDALSAPATPEEQATMAEQHRLETSERLSCLF